MNLSSITWNWNFFGAVGYLGVGVAVIVLLLWVLHFVFKAKPIICQAAVVLAVVAFGLAKINSLTYVNKIQLDPAAQKAVFDAQQEAKRKALLDSRGGEVAQIRFAEDGDDEFLDRAGMDETDLKYFDKQISGKEEADDESEGGEPAWKKEKKTRTGADSESGTDDNVLEAASEREPILMPEAEMTMANRLDTWVLRVTGWLVWLGFGVVILDHLRRSNIYGEAYLPLPVASSLTNTLTPYPPVVVRPENPRRSQTEELAWLLKRGDSFIYLTDDVAQADKVEKELQHFENRRLRPIEILRADRGKDEMAFSNDFAFETWWYGRASIVVGSAAHANQLTEKILLQLEHRKNSRATVRQTAHLIWDLSEPVPAEWEATFERLARRTGVSLFLFNSESITVGESKRPHTADAPQPA